MTGARRQSGGIATANLNILHALVELAATKAGLRFFREEGDRPDFLPAWVNFNHVEATNRLFSAPAPWYARNPF
jgi:hypothetical protein